jgi:hypothetical protein
MHGVPDFSRLAWVAEVELSQVTRIENMHRLRAAARRRKARSLAGEKCGGHKKGWSPGTAYHPQSHAKLDVATL